MEYRIAREEDLKDIIEIKNEVKQRIMEENLPIWLDGYPQDSILLEDVQAKQGRVVLDCGKIVGYACFHPANTEYPIGTFQKNNIQSFGRVMIRNSHLGKHYGSFLVRSLIEEAKKLPVEGIGILADACNVKAIRLYQRYGFIKEGTAQFDYGFFELYSLYF